MNDGALAHHFGSLPENLPYSPRVQAEQVAEVLRWVASLMEVDRLQLVVLPPFAELQQ